LIIVGLLQEAVGYLNILVAKDAEES
jgi:hypothetical protein